VFKTRIAPGDEIVVGGVTFVFLRAKGLAMEIGIEHPPGMTVLKTGHASQPAGRLIERLRPAPPAKENDND